MSISQTEISQQVGVSRTAVSHVLNGRGYMVSAETRDRILHVVESSGYHRNALVRALKANRTHVIGIVVPEIGLSFFAEIIEAVEQEARSRGLQCFLCQTHSRPEFLEKDVTVLREYRVDGILIVPASERAAPQVYRTLLQQKFPFVIADVKIAGLDAPFVGNDNHLASQLATRHLLELGHRRIAFINGYPENPSSKERLAGYRKALKGARVPLDESLVTGGGFSFEEGQSAIARLLKSDADFTAVITPSDFVALGVVQELKESGRRVPDDVSVVGCGNLDVSRMVTPSLTTIDQNPKELGKKAIDILINQIEGKSHATRSAIVPPELIVRKSSRAIS